jgi:hypothetical protein
MNKQDIKVGMLVKNILYASVGIIIDYPGGHWFFVLCGEKIDIWNIGFCEPLGI